MEYLRSLANTHALTVLAVSPEAAEVHKHQIRVHNATRSPEADPIYVVEHVRHSDPDAARRAFALVTAREDSAVRPFVGDEYTTRVVAAVRQLSPHHDLLGIALPKHDASMAADLFYRLNHPPAV